LETGFRIYLFYNWCYALVVLFLWLYFTDDLDSCNADSENCSREADRETKKKRKQS